MRVALNSVVLVNRYVDSSVMHVEKSSSTRKKDISKNIT